MLRATLAMLAVLGLIGCGSAPPPRTVRQPPPSAPVAQSEEEQQTAGTGRGWLGVSLAANSPAEAGVLVERVVPRSPAADAGVLPGDVLLRIGNVPVNHPRDVLDAVTRQPPGARVALAVRRQGQDRLFSAELGDRPAEDALIEREFVGQAAPQWRLQTVQGSVPDSVRALEGRVVVVEFWASWCPVCPYLTPTLNDWHQRWAGQGVEIVGVSTDSFETADRAARLLRMDHPVAIDVEGQTTRAYAAFALPTLFVIDQRGTVRQVVIGYDPPKLRATELLIEQLLDEG